MTSSISKRSQARNEKALQELIKTVPGNERCADCQARNPGWASWSLGIFLCMRCAALHRKIGTHISKVKSLSMDAWTSDQVENMKKVGNTASNQRFNPKNTRPPIPLDVDEVDSAMERFIRLKYEQKAYTTEGAIRRPADRSNTGGTASSDDRPPPPPPKTGRRFGFGLRSSSSAVPLSKVSSAPTTIHSSKPRVFGATIGVSEDGMEWKLTTLKEMGFRDEKRNSSILKGLNGDLERAIESLVRLGEGPGPMTKVPISAPLGSKQATTPAARTQSQPQPAPVQTQFASSNPWQTQAQRAGQASPPKSASSYNPFENISPPPAPFPQNTLEASFQNLSMGQTQTQNLFPNATGGYPQHQDQHARLQQSMTPPIPQFPNQLYYNNPYAQQQTYNPFVNAAAAPPIQTPVSANPFLNAQQTLGSPNPYINQPNLNTVLASPNQVQYQQIAHNPWLQQQGPVQQLSQPVQESPTQYYSPNPFYPTANELTPSQLAFQNQYQHQLQPLMAQQTGRFDKSSILALYNYPQLAPQPLQQENAGADPTTSRLPPNNAPAASPQRSVTMPVSGSKNPFLSSGGIPSPVPQAGGHATNHGIRESMDSGRHSPDAFASLSARFVR